MRASSRIYGGVGFTLPGIFRQPLKALLLPQAGAEMPFIRIALAGPLQALWPRHVYTYCAIMTVA